ncbi:MAG: hypothetical protein MUE34_09930, partial [Acidimicrobiales bacterium]|nr:hypothetical protein [Acidimicrobiales bacterium]
LLPHLAHHLAEPPAAVAVAAPAPVPLPALADPVLGPPTPGTTRVDVVDAVALGGVLAVAMALLAPWVVPRWLPGEPTDVAGVVAVLSVVLFADVAAAPFRAALRARGGLTGPRSHRHAPRPVTLPALAVGLLPLLVDARSSFAWAVAVAASSVVAAGAVALQASSSVPEVRLALRRPLLRALATSAVVAVGCAQVVVARASAPDALAVAAAAAAAVGVLVWLAERLRPPRPAPRPEVAATPERSSAHAGRRRHTASRHRRPSAAGHAR